MELLQQTVAVIGKEPALELIKRESWRKTNRNSSRCCGNCKWASSIYEQPSLNGAEYTFKHLLTLKVAYNSLLGRAAAQNIRADRPRLIEAALNLLGALPEDAERMQTEPKKALAILNDTLTHIRGTRENTDEAGILRLKGEVVLMRQTTATAEAKHCFRAAIEFARRQEARWWELRTTRSLARLLRDTGRRSEAPAMLSNIYNWFTDGFDSADLKDAKTLLDQLND
jgi:hypothetical protein